MSNICCPKCGEKLSFAVTSQLMNESRMSFEISPNPGELLSARNVGGCIENLDKLLTSIGKDMGAKTTVLIENVSSTEGKIKVDLLLARHKPGVKDRKAAPPAGTEG